MAEPKRTVCVATTRAGGRCRRRPQKGKDVCWNHDPDRLTMSVTRNYQHLDDRQREFLVICTARCLPLHEVLSGWREQFPNVPEPSRPTILRYRLPQVAEHEKWGPYYEEEHRRWMKEVGALPFATQESRVYELCKMAEDLSKRIADPTTLDKRQIITIFGDDHISKTTEPGRADLCKELLDVLEQLAKETTGIRTRSEIVGPDGEAFKLVFEHLGEDDHGGGRRDS